MTLEDRITHDLKEAMRAKDAAKLNVLRAVKTAFTNYKTGKDAKEFTDVVGNSILQKMVKSRNETISLALVGDRGDIAVAEQIEVDYLKEYLPKEIESDLLNEVIDTLIHIHGKDLGVIMKAVKFEIEDRGYPYDGKLVSSLVKSKLN